MRLATSLGLVAATASALAVDYDGEETRLAAEGAGSALAIPTFWEMPVQQTTTIFMARDAIPTAADPASTSCSETTPAPEEPTTSCEETTPVPSPPTTSCETTPLPEITTTSCEETTPVPSPPTTSCEETPPPVVYHPTYPVSYPSAPASYPAYPNSTVTLYTTVCPSPTVFEHESLTYTVTEPTTLTLPCNACNEPPAPPAGTAPPAAHPGTGTPQANPAAGLPQAPAGESLAASAGLPKAPGVPGAPMVPIASSGGVIVNQINPAPLIGGLAASILTALGLGMASGC